MSEEDYGRITYDFTMAAAKVLREQSPHICFCFISGSDRELLDSKAINRLSEVR
jgi:hypothetical protein